MSARRPLDWLLLIVLVALWGSAFMLIKIAVASLPPLIVVAGRLTIGAVFLVIIVLLTRASAEGLGRYWPNLLALAIMGNCLPFYLISWGQQRVDSALAGILMGVMPLTTLVLAHFFVAGERLNASKVTGFVLGFLGIIVLMGPQALTRLGGSVEVLISQLAIFAGAVSYAIAGIIAKKLND